MKKKAIGLLISVLMVLVLLLPVHGATKTTGLFVSADSFRWVTAQLIGTYSSGSFTSGDINYVYVYAGLSSKKKGITAVKPKKVSGFVQGTLSGVTKKATKSVTL